MNPTISAWRDVLRLLAGKPSHSEIRAFQRKRLAALLEFAGTEVPCYGALFRSPGARVDEIKDLEDLRRIPQVFKSQLRGIPENERIARGISLHRLIAHKTSGSTGQPVIIRRTASEEFLLGLLRQRADRLSGKRARDLMAVLTEGSMGLQRTLPARVAASLGVFRQVHVPISGRRAQIASSLARTAPDIIAGYSNSMRNVSIAAEAFGDEFPPPRMLIAGGEMITPEIRTQMERGFRAPLHERYAAHEFNLLAWQCPHGTGLLHTCDEGAIVEVLRNDEPVAEGEQGDVVATALHSFAMPFIRYRTGDRAVRGPTPCPCGWPTGTLRSVDGRMSDYFLLPGGRWTHPISIVGPLMNDEIGWVDRHKLVQEREDSVTMYLTTLRPAPPGVLQRIEAQARRTLGPEVHFRIELVDSLEIEPGRKFIPYISHSAPRDQRDVDRG